MCTNICGNDCCRECPVKDSCKGCSATKGRPWGGRCMVAGCCLDRGLKSCKECTPDACELRKGIIEEFNALNIPGMPKVERLYELNGEYVNLEYTLPNGAKTRLLDDKRVYLGCQIPKEGTERCYGLIADENFLIVSEYGAMGADPKLVLLKRKNEK